MIKQDKHLKVFWSITLIPLISILDVDISLHDECIVIYVLLLILDELLELQLTWYYERVLNEPCYIT